MPTTHHKPQVVYVHHSSDVNVDHRFLHEVVKHLYAERRSGGRCAFLFVWKSFAVTGILIRCDASLSIGSGHVMRCRTLARELQRRGVLVSFLCRRQPGDLISLLQQEFVVLALPEQTLAVSDGLEGRDLYGAWLGCSQDQDAAQCLEALAEAGTTSVSWLIEDHYGLDACWEAQMLVGLADGASSPKLLVIDDLADRPHQADLLLDLYFFGDAIEHRYQDLVQLQCINIIGPL